MGKIRRRRSRGVRYDPSGTGKTTQSSVETGDSCQDSVENVNGNGNKVTGTAGLRSIIDKISSDDPGERVTGLNVLASLALENKSAELIVKHQMVSSIIPFLKDSNLQVRLATAGTLRNLCAGGSDEVVEEMVKQGVLCPLSQLLSEYSNNVPSPRDTSNGIDFTKGLASDADGQDIDDDTTKNFILVHAIHLLWNLCECNEDALNVLNKDGLVNILLHHINPNEWGYLLATSAADCLLCITENNQNAASSVLQVCDNLLSIISNKSNLSEPSWLHYIVTISGVLVNINYCSSGGPSFHAIFEILSTVIDIDIPSSLPKNTQSQTKKSKSNVEDIEYLISAQQLGFEIVSNFCCNDDDEDDWVDSEVAECGSDDEMCAEEEGLDEDIAEDNILPEVLEAVRHYAIVEKMLRKITLYPEIIPQSKPPISEKLFQLLCSSLFCLQSIVSCLDVRSLGGVPVLMKTWQALGNMSFATEVPKPALLESCCGAMRAIMDKLTLEKCKDESVITTKAEVEVICVSGKNCSLPSVRANVCRMLGNLATLLHKVDPQNQEVVSDITRFLLQISSNDPSLWVCSEAIDTLIDIYSDDDTDKLATQLGLVEGFRAVQTKFKAKFNQERKKIGEHRPLIMTVKDNLTAFIKYKAPRAFKQPQETSME